MSQVSRFRSSRYPSVPLICFLAVFCTCVARNPVDSSKTVSSNLTTTKKWPSITFPNQISNSIANCKANCQSIWTTKKSIKRKVKLFFFTTKSVRCNNLQNQSNMTNCEKYGYPISCTNQKRNLLRTKCSVSDE